MDTNITAMPMLIIEISYMMICTNITVLEINAPITDMKLIKYQGFEKSVAVVVMKLYGEISNNKFIILIMISSLFLFYIEELKIQFHLEGDSSRISIWTWTFHHHELEPSGKC